MSLILAIHTLGETYGMLPSQVMAQGSTIDLYIMDAALSYREYRSKKAEGKLTDTYKQEDLQAMIQRTKASV